MTKIFALLIAAGTFWMSACTPARVQRWNHEQRPQNGIDQSERSQKMRTLRSVIDPLLQELPAAVEVVEEDKKLRLGEIINKIFLRYPAAILNSELIAEPELQEDLLRLLRVYNHALIRVLRAMKEKPETNIDGVDVKKILQVQLAEYKKALTFGCYDGQQGVSIERNCRNLDFFVMDSQTALITAFLAQTEAAGIKALREAWEKVVAALPKDSKCDAVEACSVPHNAYLKSVNEFSVFLYASLALKSRTEFDSVRTLYVSHVRDLQNMYSALPDSPVKTAAVRRNCQVFGSMMLLADGGLNKDKGFQEFMDGFNPVDTHATGLEFCPKHANKLREEWFSTRLVKNGKIDADNLIKNYVEKVNQNQDEKESSNFFNPSYGFKEKFLRTQPDAVGMAENLGLRPYSTDIYFYLVNEIYYSRMEVDFASHIWRSLGPLASEATLYETINSFLRLQVSYLVVKTNRHFRNFFREKGFGSSEVFRLAVTHALQMSKHWKTVKDQAKMFHTFLSNSIGSTVTDYDSDRKVEYDKELQALAGLKQEISYISVWPNMIMFSYFLAKFNGSITFESWWFGSVTIALDDIIADFLEGLKIKSWFDFGDETMVLNRYQIIHAFSFLYKTNTIDTYAATEKETGGKSMVDELSFFETAFEKYIRKAGDDLQRLNVELKDRFTSGTFSDFIKQCNDPFLKMNLEAADAFKSSPFLDPANFLKGYEQLYFEGYYGELEPSMSSSYKSKEGLFAGVNAVRDHYLSKINYLETLIGVLKQDTDSILKRERLDTSELKRKKNLQERVEHLMGKLQRYRAFADDYYRMALRVHRAVGDCYMRVVVEDNRRRREFMKREIEYFRDVHAAMTALNVIEKQGLQGNDKAKILSEVRQIVESKEGDYANLQDAERADILERVSGFFARIEPQPQWTAQDYQQQAQLLLGVHNDEKRTEGLRADKLMRQTGSEYSDLIRHLGSPIAIKGKNQITSSHYWAFKSDFYLRMRYFAAAQDNLFGNTQDGSADIAYRSFPYYSPDLPRESRENFIFEPVAPNLLLELENNFLTWDVFVKDKEGKKAQFSPSQDNFVQTVMTNQAIPGGVVDWYYGDSETSGHTHHLSILRNHQRLTAALYLVGPISLKPGEDCSSPTEEQIAKGFCDTVTSAELIEETINNIEYVKLDDDDKKILTYVSSHKDGKFSRNALEKLLLDKIESQTGILNKMIEEIATMEVGSYNQKSLQSRFTLTTLKGINEFYVSENALFRPVGDDFDLNFGIFDFDPTVVSLVRSKYRPLYKSYLDKTLELIRVAREYEVKEAVHADRYVFALQYRGDSGVLEHEMVKVMDGWKSLVPPVRPATSDRPASLFLLTDLAVSNVRTAFENYTIETRCALLPQPGDPDQADAAIFEGQKKCEKKLEKYMSAWP